MCRGGIALTPASTISCCILSTRTDVAHLISYFIANAQRSKTCQYDQRELNETSRNPLGIVRIPPSLQRPVFSSVTGTRVWSAALPRAYVHSRSARRLRQATNAECTGMQKANTATCDDGDHSSDHQEKNNNETQQRMSCYIHRRVGTTSTTSKSIKHKGVATTKKETYVSHAIASKRKPAGPPPPSPAQQSPTSNARSRISADPSSAASHAVMG